MKLKKLTNREIVEILYHDTIILTPQFDSTKQGIKLHNGRELAIKKGELYEFIK